MKNKRLVPWPEIIDRLNEVSKNFIGGKVFGVPRGGMIAAGFLRCCKKVFDPREADFILDDIVDSGATQRRYKELFPNKPFVSLYTKSNEWLVFPWEGHTGPEDAVVRILEYIGEDPSRDGLMDTPARVIRSFNELCSGYNQDPSKVLSKTFKSSYNEMVLLRGIQFTSLCEHHMLPFSGTVGIGYIPRSSVVGISKLARLVEVFSRRLQIQERLTQQIADAMEEHLKPIGTGVVVMAHHHCMGCRGVRQPTTEMRTVCLRGAILDKPEARAEFLKGVNRED